MLLGTTLQVFSHACPKTRAKTQQGHGVSSQAVPRALRNGPFRAVLSGDGSSGFGLRSKRSNKGVGRCRPRAVSVFAELSEEEAWKKRAEEAKEAGNSAPPSGEWKWTLNWNQIEPLITVGSCPRSPSDVDRLVDEAGIEAIVCLQSDACFEALKIDWPAIRERALERGVVMTRIAVRDFDHNDQANMLPEAVRTLAGHIHHNRRTYVHCTAGINRATLTTVGYLTFVQNMDLDDAVRLVKERRPVAHPYIDCWKTVHKRLLDARGEELGYLSGQIYQERCQTGEHGDSNSDWEAAERRLINETFRRRVGVDVHTTSSMMVIAERREAEARSLASSAEEALLEASDARKQAAEARAELEELQSEVAAVAGASKKRAEMAEQLATALQAQATALKEELNELRAENAKLRASQMAAGSGGGGGNGEGQVNGEAPALPGLELQSLGVNWPTAEGKADPLLAYCQDNPDVEECRLFYQMKEETPVPK